MANTVWNGSDKSPSVTLTGSNLIATNNNNAVAGVRAVDKQVSGKWYWECTCTTWVNGSSGVGVATGYYPLAASSIGSPISTVIGCCAVNRNGQLVRDGGSLGTLFTVTSGSVICVALDLNARLIWFRVGAAGLWQGSGTADPVTGAGGTSIPGLGGGIQVYPAVSPNALNDAATANFGDTAFTGAVPAGFTSGFTAGAVINTNALATQVAAEHWFTTSPQSQVTQVALEHWATVADGVFVPPPTGANVSVMVLA